MTNETAIVKWMIARAAKFINANPENPSEVVEEITFRGNLRSPVNFSGEVDGYSVKITTDVRPGGHSATVLQGWRAL